MNITIEQIKEFVEQAHMAGQKNQGNCEPSYYEAMVYYSVIVEPKLDEILNITYCSCDRPSGEGLQARCGNCGGEFKRK